MQSVRKSGFGNVAVQISGGKDPLAMGRTGICLQLRAKHIGACDIRSEIDLLRPETQLLDLIGRDTEIASLNAWLHDPREILVRGLVGQAGMGKTRLAIELCKRANAAGWKAGFLDTDDLGAFVTAQRKADWSADEPTLIVIDHAGQHTPAINALLHSLAFREVAARPRLRFLLLERHSSLTEGWWNKIICFDSCDDRLSDFFDQEEPAELPPIGTLTDRRAILSGAMRECCKFQKRPVIDLPPDGNNLLFDKKLANGELGTEPLFLMMTGIAVAFRNPPTILAFDKLDPMMEIACRERDRLRRLATQQMISEDFLLYLVACITLSKGRKQRDLRNLITEECNAFPYMGNVKYEKLSAALGVALPVRIRNGKEIVTGIEPDIVGKAFCLLILATNPDLAQPAFINRF